MSQAADLVKKARTRSGISQRELAIRAGTTQAAISRIERGLEEPTVERLEQVLAGLGWKPVIELAPIAAHDADPRRLHLEEGNDPSIRLEGGMNLFEFGKDLFGAALEKA